MRLQLVNQTVHCVHISCIEARFRLEVVRDVFDDGVKTRLMIPRGAGKGANCFLPDVKAAVLCCKLHESGYCADDEKLENVSSSPM